MTIMICYDIYYIMIIDIIVNIVIVIIGMSIILNDDSCC